MSARREGFILPKHRVLYLKNHFSPPRHSNILIFPFLNVYYHLKAVESTDDVKPETDVNESGALWYSYRGYR